LVVGGDASGTVHRRLVHDQSLLLGVIVIVLDWYMKAVGVHVRAETDEICSRNWGTR
jgi:hypothetical protein